MPRYQIDRSTNFIIENESWSVIEYDHTSVPGVIYLSLTENKVNFIYDDIENNIADIDKMAEYTLLTSDDIQKFEIGKQINPIFTLQKNGMLCEEKYNFKTTDKSKARFIDGVLTAISEGLVDIVIYLEKFPNINKTITVEVINSQSEDFSAYINGNDSIRLDRVESYSLVGTKEIVDKVIFKLEETNLAKINKIENNKCEILANNKNKIGSIKLIAIYDNKEYIKEISIIPLW